VAAAEVTEGEYMFVVNLHVERVCK
jgi:hypothetical protein